MGWKENHLLTKEYDSAAYPELKVIPTMNKGYPGGVILEHDMMRGLRYCCPPAFALAPLGYMFRRSRTLNVDKKALLAFLEPHLYPSLALGSLVGLVGGAAGSLLSAPYRFENDAAVVAEAIRLRTDRVGDQWTRTFARCAACCCIVSVCTAPGLLPYRAALGLSSATLMSIPVSYSEFDKGIEMMF
jgi:hypothetical protein